MDIGIPLHKIFESATFVTKQDAQQYKKALNGKGLMWLSWKLMDALYTEESASRVLDSSIEEALMQWPVKIKHPNSEKIYGGFIAGLDYVPSLNRHVVTPEDWESFRNVIIENTTTRETKKASIFVNAFASAVCQRLGSDPTWGDGLSHAVYVDGGIVVLEKQQGQVLLTTVTKNHNPFKLEA